MLLPALSGSAIRQPLCQDAGAVGDMVTLLLRLMASLRASASDALMSVAIDFILWLLMNWLNAGAVKEARMPTMTTTIMSSVMVNPCWPARRRLNCRRQDFIPDRYQLVEGVLVPAWSIVSACSLFAIWDPFGVAVMEKVGGGPPAVATVIV